MTNQFSNTIQTLKEKIKERNIQVSDFANSKECEEYYNVIQLLSILGNLKQDSGGGDKFDCEHSEQMMNSKRCLEIDGYINSLAQKYGRLQIEHDELKVRYRDLLFEVRAE